MSVSTARRHAASTAVGGALTTVVLALDDVAPGFVGLAVVVPVLLGFVVLELYGRHHEQYGTAGRAGVGLTAVGLAGLLVATLLYVVLPPGLVAVAFVAVPGVVGLVALAVGSALLAVSLHRLALLRTPGAVCLGLGVPLVPLVGAVLAATFGRGAPLGPVLPGAVTGFSGVPYGVGWMLVGYRLWTTVEGVEASGRRPSTGEPSPHVVVAGVVGVAFALLGVAGVVSLGPLSGTPWVNRSAVLDAGHLLVGAVGLAVVARRSADAARTYDRAVGLLSFAVVAVVLGGTFAGVGVLARLAASLGLHALTQTLLYLPAGVVLAAVGFGVDAE